MSKWNDLFSYYEERYRFEVGWCLHPGEKIYLGDKADRKCRFCGQREPEVTFKTLAHALPDCLGNKTLFTYYECDACNQAFGAGCENDFGNWSLPMRTMTRTRGKKGIPTTRQGPGKQWRIGEHPTGISINAKAEEGFYQDDEVNKKLFIPLTRDPYRPAMVVYALAKIALSIMPEDILPLFQEVLEWIRPSNTPLPMTGPTPFLHTFMVNGLPRDTIIVSLLTRLDDDFPAPYAVLILAYGKELLQIAIPCRTKDSPFYGSALSHFPYRWPGGSERPLAYSSLEVVKDDQFEITLSYDNRIKNEPDQPSEAVPSPSDSPPNLKSDPN